MNSIRRIECDAELARYHARRGEHHKAYEHRVRHHVNAKDIPRAVTVVRWWHEGPSQIKDCAYMILARDMVLRGCDVHPFAGVGSGLGWVQIGVGVDDIGTMINVVDSASGGCYIEPEHEFKATAWPRTDIHRIDLQWSYAHYVSCVRRFGSNFCSGWPYHLDSASTETPRADIEAYLQMMCDRPLRGELRPNRERARSTFAELMFEHLVGLATL